MAATTRRIVALLPFTWMWWIVGALLPLVAFPRIPTPVTVWETFPLGEIRVGVDASHAPFAAYVNDTLVGIDIDLANALASQIGLPVRFVPLGYDGLYDALYADQIDVLIAAVPRDPTRTNRVLYTPSYFDAGIALVTSRSSAISQMSDVSGRQLAYEFGSSAHSEADIWARRILPFTRMPYQYTAYALDAVRLGQADAALVDTVALRQYLHEHPEWDAHTPRIVLSIPYVIALRIDRPSQAVMITAALEDLRDSGALDTLISRWL